MELKEYDEEDLAYFAKCDAADAAESAWRTRVQSLIIKNRGELLELLAPQHNHYTTLDCSDEKPYKSGVSRHGTIPCLRCVLLTVDETHKTNLGLSLFGRAEDAH